MIQPDAVLLARLQVRYAESHRAYHTWDHIEALLRHFQELGTEVHDPTRVLWALYWHDAIYDPRRTDNEAKSAQLLQSEGAGRIPETTLEEAVGLIRATADHRLPLGLTEEAQHDAALFLDMDLSILAAPTEAFDEYERNIRKEYAFVPKFVYKPARSKVLRGFLEREHLYFSPICRERWEDQARNNLRRSLGLGE